jgi:hypothetical protein
MKSTKTLLQNYKKSCSSKLSYLRVGVTSCYVFILNTSMNNPQPGLVYQAVINFYFESAPTFKFKLITFF